METVNSTISNMLSEIDYSSIHSNLDGYKEQVKKVAVKVLESATYQEYFGNTAVEAVINDPERVLEAIDRKLEKLRPRFYKEPAMALEMSDFISNNINLRNEEKMCIASPREILGNYAFLLSEDEADLRAMNQQNLNRPSLSSWSTTNAPTLVVFYQYTPGHLIVDSFFWEVEAETNRRNDEVRENVSPPAPSPAVDDRETKIPFSAYFQVIWISYMFGTLAGMLGWIAGFWNETPMQWSLNTAGTMTLGLSIIIVMFHRDYKFSFLKSMAIMAVTMWPTIWAMNY